MSYLVLFIFDIHTYMNNDYWLRQLVSYIYIYLPETNIAPEKWMVGILGSSWATLLLGSGGVVILERIGTPS